ncbi:MAG: thioredoxin family protein [Rhizobacter sp.]|nr:thioredoxin family protein [Burkholderiales bacterium]
MHISASATQKHRLPTFAKTTTLLAGVAAFLCATLLHAAPIKTEHAEVELIAEKTALVAGEKNLIGLSIKHAPHWHTYWKNPGDSGYPTKITWDVPPGYGVGEFDWPTPKRLATGPIVNFGYEGEVLLPVTISVPLAAKVGESVTLKGKAEWLVCKDVCIPEEGNVSVTLPVAASNAIGADGARFAAARAATPGDASAWKATLHTAANPARDAWLDLVAPAGATALTALDVFPVLEQVNDPSVQQVYRTPQGYAVKLKLVDGVKLPERMPIVLAASNPIGAKGETAGTTLATVSNTAFVLPAGASALGGAASSADSSANALTFWSALLLAFIGGMVLNLMPCVFPVLSLKILSFAKHSGKAAESRTAMRQHGIYYAVGVVLSFLALAGVMLALKSAGSSIGWGFQLQNPGVVWVLAVIFFMIGLNLMGAFEVGQLAPSSLLSMQAKHPGIDAFFSGVLAVIAASPCTAPFMGAALGFALTQSAAAALAVFAALGVGMALPYVLLAWFPKWLDKLPRPGQWMVTFKQLLAFPMFLTVVWLVWVISLQAGADGAAIGLLGLVGLAFAAWLIGSMRSGVRWAGVAAAVTAMALAWPTAELAQAAVMSATPSKANWQPWDPATVAKLNAEGKPVFVDFTAAWCVSCQANKRLVLSRAEIVSLFEQKQVTLMRADWTNRDERITQALAAMNRSGVPVYVLHAPGKAPQLLPELLTTGIVKEALLALP